MESTANYYRQVQQLRNQSTLNQVGRYGLSASDQQLAGSLLNPDPIYIEVKETDGKVVEWRIETGPTNSMMRGGLRKTDFLVGSEVVVKGYRAKNGSPTANGRSIIMADGRDYGLGSNAPAAGNTQ